MINKDTQKIKRIELPICTTPEVRTYSYYALPQCIIMAEERIGKRIAEFEICETDNDTWTSIGMKKEGMHWKYDEKSIFCEETRLAYFSKHVRWEYNDLDRACRLGVISFTPGEGEYINVK